MRQNEATQANLEEDKNLSQKRNERVAHARGTKGRAREDPEIC